jgi:hypothetical protein
VNVRCIDHKSTPAQYALAERPDVCRRLLERGADADVFMPARLGDVALAARLLDADPQAVAARINEPGYAPVPPLHIYCWTLGFGLSPHDVALKFGHGDVRELLVRRSPPRVRFVNAVVAGDEAAARALLDQDPSVLASPSHAEHSLLAHAIFGGRREAAHLMLRLGFDETAGGVDGGNALHARRAGWATSSSSTCCSGAGACRSTVAIPSTSARRSVGQRSGRSTAARAGETILRSSIDSSLLERTSRHREMVRADR